MTTATEQCPFMWCGVWVTMNTDLIPFHWMKNTTGELCPTSLQHWPLRGPIIDTLLDQEDSMRDRVLDYIRRPPPDVSSIPNDVDRSRGVGMRRFKLEMHDPAWQLGGREDEDIPESSGGEVIPLRPDGAHYGGIYGGTPVENAIQIAVAYVGQAKLKEGEAYGAGENARNMVDQSMGGMEELLNEAMSSLHAATEVTQSERLNGAHFALENAKNELNQLKFSVALKLMEITNIVRGAEMLQDEWVGIVTSA